MMLAMAEAFRQAFVVLGVELDRRKLNRRDASRPPNGGLSEHHKWCSAKGVAHFNLHQAVESVFKLMLALERARIPKGQHGHNLCTLFGRLSPQTKTDFKAIYKDTVRSQGESFEAVLYHRGRNPPDPDSLPKLKKPKSATLRHFLDFLDNVVSASTRRYQAESVGRGEPLYYLVDTQPYFSMLERMDLYARNRWNEMNSTD